MLLVALQARDVMTPVPPTGEEGLGVKLLLPFLCLVIEEGHKRRTTWNIQHRLYFLQVF